MTEPLEVHDAHQVQEETLYEYRHAYRYRY